MAYQLCKKSEELPVDPYFKIIDYNDEGRRKAKFGHVHQSPDAN